MVQTLFADRRAAGRALAEALRGVVPPDAVVLGIPRGGVVVAAEVARLLALPLGVVVVRKLGSAGNEEFAVGAIADGVRVIDDGALRASGMDAAQLAQVEARERAELTRRAGLFRAPVSASMPDAESGPAADLAGACAVIVDDGIATGATAVAACRAARARGAVRIVLAAPVAPAQWSPPAGIADEFVCPHPQSDFWAVGRFYTDFTQVADAEVTALLTP